MSVQTKHYFTYSFINKDTKEYVGWNSEVAETVDEAIEQALHRYDNNWDENTDYIVDEASFTKQTDDEMEKLMWYSS
jgi:20S proteasome alpha/beta subunit